MYHRHYLIKLFSKKNSLEFNCKNAGNISLGSNGWKEHLKNGIKFTWEFVCKGYEGEI